MLRRPGFLPLRQLLIGRTQVIGQKYLARIRPLEKITTGSCSCGSLARNRSKSLRSALSSLRTVGNSTRYASSRTIGVPVAPRWSNLQFQKSPSPSPRRRQCSDYTDGLCKRAPKVPLLDCSLIKSAAGRMLSVRAARNPRRRPASSCRPPLSAACAWRLCGPWDTVITVSGRGGAEQASRR